MIQSALMHILRLAEDATVLDLLIILVLLLSVFLATRIRTMIRIRNARNRLPLTIGGWGTRGKSGVERKKGALFHALGFETFVKTTGCEAILLHSHLGADPREIFVYRPNDKATIREHQDLMMLAARMETDVFCWECMALQPEFVRILETEWMKDAITLITNTYPDHEDRQGPAGIDVARVMTEIIPHNGRIFTAEEQMTPLLMDHARRRGTTLQAVRYEDYAFIPDGVLHRFPYDPHPKNLALVTVMAESLGVSRNFAWREIANHIVPDLGAFKTYPPAPYLGRTLLFTNGMSANERLGFLSNWNRGGFAGATIDQHPGDFIIVVLNNRDDRVARSKVFADVTLFDIPEVDLVVSIGTNLTGLRGYFEDSLQRRIRNIDIYAADEDGESDAVAAFRRQCRDLRVPVSFSQLAARLKTMQDAEGNRIESGLLENEAELRELDINRIPLSLQPFATREIERFRTARKTEQEIATTGPIPSQSVRDAVNAGVQSFIKQEFSARLELLYNSAATGDQIIDAITKLVPPGYRARIMGAQNIKGTGLGFMYRWVDYDAFDQTLADLQKKPPDQASEILDILEQREWHLLEATRFLHDLSSLKTAVWAQDANVQSRLLSLQQRADTILSALQPVTTRVGMIDRGRLWLLHEIEKTLEFNISRRRNRRVRRIYRDLADGLLSHSRAAQLLAAEVSSQKGGWLVNRF